MLTLHPPTDFLLILIVNDKSFLEQLWQKFWCTVRPDWICMRAVSLDRLWKERQPLYVFDFLISLLNIWNNFKVLSRFIQNWIKPPACWVCIEFFLPIGWRTFIWLKNSWFKLRDVGILYSQAAIQRPIVDFPAFLETALAEKIAGCDHTTCDPNR